MNKLVKVAVIFTAMSISAFSSSADSNGMGYGLGYCRDDSKAATGSKIEDQPLNGLHGS